MEGLRLSEVCIEALEQRRYSVKFPVELANVIVLEHDSEGDIIEEDTMELKAKMANIIEKTNRKL